jgi:nitrogen fixation protein FixH
MRIPTLPPNIRWPLFVVGLLSISISASVYTLLASQSDGGAAVVENYYERGKQWDQESAMRRVGASLSVDVQVSPAPENEALHAVVLTVRDSSGAPVTGLQGSLRALRPDRSGVQASVPLAPRSGAPGVYRQVIPLDARGLWDLEMKATYGGEALLRSIRVEV